MGEIRSLAQKASKGAGMPWGLAEEAGFAIEWLERRGAPGVASLAALLLEIDRDGIYKPGSCPIGNGAWISDSGALIGTFPMSIRQPLLMSPFISNILVERILQLSWNNNSLLLAHGHLELVISSGLDAKGVFQCETRLMDKKGAEGKRVTRVPEDRIGSVSILETYAARTYAPATEASRMAGAGAGTSDND